MKQDIEAILTLVSHLYVFLHRSERMYIYVQLIISDFLFVQSVWHPLDSDVPDEARHEAILAPVSQRVFLHRSERICICVQLIISDFFSFQSVWHPFDPVYLMKQDMEAILTLVS